MIQSKHQVVHAERFHQDPRSVDHQTVVMATKIALQAVVLSGGASRRMGRDKALLPHAAGGTWLEHITGLLNSLDLPVLVLTIHRSHEQLLQTSHRVSVQRDATPGAGPLQAIAPVFPADQQQALLVAPVDMPELQADGLRQLISSWQQQPSAAAVAHDGERLQPLLGIYPGGSKQRQSMLETLAAGHNSWIAWLDQIDYRAVSLPPGQLRNCNRPQ
jgi:molybdopterin-guanine dinucleotide biosynthesis protein A